mmetsp:Transcript_11609/g.38283  ORF Transcript_11609/g.38283 Transcript_11609/m.38283 type:complete len:215 (-) Transcript_11609:253-897(-)
MWCGGSSGRSRSSRATSRARKTRSSSSTSCSACTALRTCPCCSARHRRPALSRLMAAGQQGSGARRSRAGSSASSKRRTRRPSSRGTFLVSWLRCSRRSSRPRSPRYRPRLPKRCCTSSRRDGTPHGGSLDSAGMTARMWSASRPSREAIRTRSSVRTAFRRCCRRAATCTNAPHARARSSRRPTARTLRARQRGEVSIWRTTTRGARRRTCRG